MSPPGGTPRGSGDPRKRAAADSPSPAPGGARWAVLAALALAFVLVLLAVLTLQGDDAPGTTADGAQPGGASSVDAQALIHAEVACDVMSKAAEAARASKLDERTRYAVAVLLLDQAVIESGRAAQSDTGLVELDTALQAAHAAGHEGDHVGWQHALRSAHAQCRVALG